ncbi:MAG: hypothetical protein JOZ65_13320, partial [Chloroflexi bacterium]|nr:hypothetical protein [Chloroflexota bacterium]
WKTWVLTSGSQLQVARPPDRTASTAELQQLKSMAAPRDDEARTSAATTRQLSYLSLTMYDATICCLPALPTLGKVQPWVLESGSQFRPGPPPADDSDQKAAELQEIKTIPHTFVTDSNAFFWQSTRSAWPLVTERQMFEARVDRDAPRAARMQALVDAESRIYAGIHFRSDVDAGLALGRSVAAAVVHRAQHDAGDSTKTKL